MRPNPAMLLPAIFVLAGLGGSTTTGARAHDGLGTCRTAEATKLVGQSPPTTLRFSVVREA